MFPVGDESADLELAIELTQSQPASKKEMSTESNAPQDSHDTLPILNILHKIIKHHLLDSPPQSAIDSVNMSRKTDLVNDYTILKFQLGRSPMMMDFAFNLMAHDVVDLTEVINSVFNGYKYVPTHQTLLSAVNHLNFLFVTKTFRPCHTNRQSPKGFALSHPVEMDLYRYITEKGEA